MKIYKLILWNDGKVLHKKGLFPIIRSNRPLSIRKVILPGLNYFSFMKKILSYKSKQDTVDVLFCYEPNLMVPKSVMKKYGYSWIDQINLDYLDKEKKVILSLIDYFNKPKVILVSGTPGSGKTTFCHELSLFVRVKYIDLTKLIKQKHLGTYNKDYKAYDVDISLLLREVISYIQNTNRSLLIDSHLSHYLPSKYADICVILTCSDLKALELRLKKRAYNGLKLRENMESQIFKTCEVDALEFGHNVVVIDTSNEYNLHSLIDDYPFLFYS